MNHQISPRFLVLLLGGVIGFLVAVVIAQPLLAIAAAPAVFVSVLAAVMYRRPEIQVTVDGPSRAVEGDRVDLVVTAQSATWVPWLQVGIELPSDLDPVNGIRHAIVSIPAGRKAVVRFPVELTRWGVARPGRVETIARGPFGMFSSARIHQPRLAIRVHPQDGNRRSVVVPARLRARVGDHRSRRHGEGSDFAEVRPFRTGDTLRSVNWRVSARRGERWVTVRHPDQSGDLVFLLDTFRDLGPEGNRLVQRAVRAAMSLADSNLDAHDRVGLLDVGRHIRWYRPRQGRIQKARLFDALLASQVERGLRAPRLEQLPLHELDAGTMVIVLTGLTDPDMSLLPIELRMHGLEVAVLECTADDHFLEASDEATELAIRLWRLIRHQRRQQLIGHGVPVMPWAADQPIELPVAALARRRGATA
ncbi:MAG: DUF58 domain-containing protein [Acidimicrobiales bacterium]